jgi:hypothetical protein
MKCKVRGPASSDYETSVTHTFEFDGVEVGFEIVTMADPMAAAFANYTDAENYTETENYVD